MCSSESQLFVLQLISWLTQLGLSRRPGRTVPQIHVLAATIKLLRMTHLGPTLVTKAVCHSKGGKREKH